MKSKGKKAKRKAGAKARKPRAAKAKSPKAAPKRKATAKPAKAKAPKRATAKKKPRRKAAKKKPAANNLTRVVQETLREPRPSGYGGKTSTRTAKPRTQKEATMAAKKGKKAAKKKAPKKRKAKAKRKAPKAAAPKKAAPKKRRKKARRKAPAAAAPAAPKKAPRKKKSSSGGSGPGQFAPGRPNNTSIEVRRAPDGHFSKLRSQPAKGHGPGEVEVIPIHRNPVDTGMFIGAAAVGGGLGFGIASLAGRMYVTSNFALSHEKDSAGNALYKVSEDGKVTHADGSPVTSADYAAQIDAFSWAREGISLGIAAISILGGMWAFEPGGIARTGALWLGVGSAVEGGVNIGGKLILPWMLRKNKTFATRLAASEVNIYLLQHPDAQKDQPSGEDWTVSGAPLGKGPGNAALGNGCVGGDVCGCTSCCAKRSQALQNCIQNYAAQAPAGPRGFAPPGDAAAGRPAPTPEPAQILNRPTGAIPDDNVRPFVSTRDQARARNSA